MLRSVLVAALCVSLPIAATADEERDPRVEEILKDLPTRAELEDAIGQMPDLNKMVTGIMDVVEDPETQATLEDVGQRLEQRFEKMSVDLEVADGEIPDLNLVIGEMMGLATDKEMMGDLLGLMFQVVDAVEENIGDLE